MHQPLRCVWRHIGTTIAALTFTFAPLSPASATPGVPGSLDTNFGSGGSTITPIGASFSRIESVTVQPDGKIVAAGYCAQGNSGDFCVARYEGGPSGAQFCSLDIDGDGRVNATTDTLIVNRIALGINTSAAINGINFPATATRNTWPLIRDYLVSQCGMSLVP